jgi:hypothetical protein
MFPFQKTNSDFSLSVYICVYNGFIAKNLEVARGMTRIQSFLNVFYNFGDEACGRAKIRIDTITYYSFILYTSYVQRILKDT